jgi:DNA repair ATPase RecN
MESVLAKLNTIAVSSAMTDKDKTELQLKKELVSVRKNIFNTAIDLDKFRKNIKDNLKKNIGTYADKLNDFTSGLSSFLPMIMNGPGGVWVQPVVLLVIC